MTLFQPCLYKNIEHGRLVIGTENPEAIGREYDAAVNTFRYSRLALNSQN